MKSDWIMPIIEELESRQFHGKVILNIHSGSIENIEKQERINKPEDNSSLSDNLASHRCREKEL